MFALHTTFVRKIRTYYQEIPEKRQAEFIF